jgi:hypothetical protein
MKIIVSYGFLKGYRDPGYCDLGMAFVVGLTRLGHEVYLIEEVNPEDCLDSRGQAVEFEHWRGLFDFEALARAYGIWPRCCLIHTQPLLTCGMTFHDLLKAASTAHLLLVIGQPVQIPIIVENVPCSAYVETDPSRTEADHFEYGVDSDFKYYDHFFTVGLNTGTPRCEIPSGGLPWQGIFQPVVLDLWPPAVNGHDGRFTTVAARAARRPSRLPRKTSGSHSDPWLRFLELPRKTGQELEVALRDGAPDQDEFRQHGWRLSGELRSLEDYRDFIGASRGGFSMADPRQVQSRTGWFSDVGARYLASGKPALVQSTGFEGYLPTGRGLLSFRTVEEAAARIEEINHDYESHCQAARRLAEEYLDSNLVLSKMLSEVGLTAVWS